MSGKVKSPASLSLIEKTEKLRDYNLNDSCLPANIVKKAK